MINKEKVIVATACVLTVIISTGFTITQGESSKNSTDYKSINTTNLIDNQVKYKTLETDTSKNIYTVEINEEIPNENLLQIANEITKENNEKYTIYIKEENNLKIQIKKDEKETLITRYIPVEQEIEGTPENYKVLAIEPFEEKTRVSIEIPASDDPNLVLGQVKSIGQKVKEEENQKGNDLGNLEIKAYYNEENNYWSYSSSDKNIINHNQIIPN